MEVVYRCCAELDVHKLSATVNVLRRGVEGKEDLEQVTTFGTMSKDLFGLARWLKEIGCTHMAMESSFVPPEPIRELRDLTRQGRKLVGKRSSCVERVQKVLEDANMLARATSRKKGSYLRSQIGSRRSFHSFDCLLCHEAQDSMLPYSELGEDFFDKTQRRPPTEVLRNTP